MKFTVGTKILLGFSLALLILIAIGAVSYRSTVKLVENGDWVAHTHQVLESLEGTLAQLLNAETGQRGYMLTGKDEFLLPYRAAVEALEPKIADVARLTADNPQQQRRLDQLKPLIDNRMEVMQQGISARDEKGLQGAAEFLLAGGGRSIMLDIRNLITQMQAEEQRLLATRSTESKTRAAATKATILYGSLAAFGVVAVCGTLIQRSITGPLGRFVEFVDRVGKGDLTRQTEITSGDEVGKLGEVINEMVSGLKQMTAQIVSVTENVNSATAQISSSTRQQVSSAKEQAATIQEISSTMQEISQTGAQIVSKAQEVAAVAEQAAAASKSGIDAVQGTNRTMEAIREQVEEVAENIVALSEKTQAVGEIISTVNEIAEQSNLLAINATIEAAEAGEDGSRFSVVAGEMKNLADQAKQCTVHVRKILGEIQKSINTSVMLTEEAVKRVESGKQQADVSEGVIRQISSTTDESIQAFQQIIGATNQQQVGFEQVAQGMQNIDLATQQTASGTVQLEQAVVSLSALSRQLQTAVSSYKV